MSFWDKSKESAVRASVTAKTQAQKTKLRAEIALLDREIKARKKTFGVELYDHLQPLSTTPEFYSSDDLLTTTLRPPLLEAQREIAALEIKRCKVKEDMAQADVRRRSAFPVKASTWQEKLSNAGKSARMATNETKLKAELSMLNSRTKDYKQKFGVNVFSIFKELEDTKGWLPTDRKIRSMFDNCCRDVEDIQVKRDNKEHAFVELGGEPIPDPGRKGGNAINVHDDGDLSLEARSNNGGGGGMISANNGTGMFVISNPSTTTTSNTTTTTNDVNALEGPGMTNTMSLPPVDSHTALNNNDDYNFDAHFSNPTTTTTASTAEGNFLGTESTIGTVDHNNSANMNDADISAFLGGSGSNRTPQDGAFYKDETAGDFLY